MALPKWLAQVNKRVFNPMELRKGTRPVLVHTGRRSGTTFRTPIDAHEIAGGFLFIMNYGLSSDWVKNVLDAGTATLEIDGGSIDLVAPRVVPIEEAYPLLPTDTKTPPGWVGVDECLLLNA